MELQNPEDENLDKRQMWDPLQLNFLKSKVIALRILPEKEDTGLPKDRMHPLMVVAF